MDQEAKDQLEKWLAQNKPHPDDTGPHQAAAKSNDGNEGSEAA